MTTEQIYRQMRQTFQQSTGQPLDESCDLSVRLYAAAAELETLYQYADWSRRQAFPQTADGQYLDYHGQMRALPRRQQTQAHGGVRILLSDRQQQDVTIPAGSTLLAPNEAEFTLDQAVIIPEGGMYQTVGVTASVCGTAGNLPRNTRFTLPNGPACIASVTAVDAFTGGTDTETDEAYRARILDSFRPGPNGANADYYRALALTVDGVVACSVLPTNRGPLTVDVIPADRDGLPSNAQMSAITALLEGRRELGIDVSVCAPTGVPVEIEMTLRCADGVAFADAAAAARSCIGSFFTGRLLGTQIYSSALSHLVFTTGLVTDCVVETNVEDTVITAAMLPVLDSLTVTEAV